jgi:hypothetical protein
MRVYSMASMFERQRNSDKYVRLISDAKEDQ